MDKDPAARHATASEMIDQAEKAFGKRVRAVITPPGPPEGREETGIREREAPRADAPGAAPSPAQRATAPDDRSRRRGVIYRRAAGRHAARGALRRRRTRGEHARAYDARGARGIVHRRPARRRARSEHFSTVESEPPLRRHRRCRCRRRQCAAAPPHRCCSAVAGPRQRARRSATSLLPRVLRSKTARRCLAHCRCSRGPARRQRAAGSAPPSPLRCPPKTSAACGLRPTVALRGPRRGDHSPTSTNSTAALVLHPVAMPAARSAAPRHGGGAAEPARCFDAGRAPRPRPAAAATTPPGTSFLERARGGALLAPPDAVAAVGPAAAALIGHGVGEPGTRRRQRGLRVSRRHQLDEGARRGGSRRVFSSTWERRGEGRRLPGSCSRHGRARL